MIKLWQYRNRPKLFGYNSWEIRRCFGDDQQKKEQEAADKAASEQRAAGQAANKQITEAGKPSQTELNYQGMYDKKAMQAPETTMQEGGPIAQALSQRILERTKTPGLDFDMNSAAIGENIGKPLWASLKARGIAAPPGSEGGGLGSQQYFQGAIPQMAQLRANAAGTDISNATNYGNIANALQQYFTTGGTNLANLLRNRQLQAAIPGAQAQQSGTNLGSQTQLSQAQLQAQRQYQDQQNLMSGLGTLGIDAAAIGLAPFTAGASLLAIPGTTMAEALKSRESATSQ